MDSQLQNPELRNNPALFSKSFLISYVYEHLPQVSSLKKKTLFIQMDFRIHVDKIIMELPNLYCNLISE